MSVIAKDIQAHWRVVQPLFSIRDEAEYDNHERDLTVTHIHALAKRFQVASAVFV